MLAQGAIWILIGYLIGSIPFGLLLTRAAGTDIRAVGSGNIGATNVLRTGNKGLAAATLLLDAGKGFAAVWLAAHFAGGSGIEAGFAAFIGHLFPVWLGFRGGKGVATLIGVTLGVLPLAALVFGLLWSGVVLATRISSLGGMIGAVGVPVAAAALGRFDLLPILVAMAVLLLRKHHDNIARLRAGTESRIGGKP